MQLSNLFMIFRHSEANIQYYVMAQGGVFSARFNNEFTAQRRFQGTASAEMIKGLQTDNAALIKGAAAVMVANAR